MFKLTYGPTSFLFTGDINGRNHSHVGAAFDNEIDSEELELWVRHELDKTRFDLRATVLQVAHHGANGSSSLRFLKAVSPTWAVIPAGHYTRYNHPNPDTLRRLDVAKVAADHILRTDEGDSTPELSGAANTDPRGDDSYVFEVDLAGIQRILRVRK